MHLFCFFVKKIQIKKSLKTELHVIIIFACGLITGLNWLLLYFCVYLILMHELQVYLSRLCLCDAGVGRGCSEFPASRWEL